jgi:hypothetical protein
VFIQVLVEKQIEAGQAIVDALRNSGFPITAAFWCRIPESGYWRLVIGSKLIDRIGPLEGYRRLHEILHRLGLWNELFGSISLLSPGDPTFHSLRETAERPGQFGHRDYEASYYSFQDAYFYSPAKSRARLNPDKRA